MNIVNRKKAISLVCSKIHQMYYSVSTFYTPNGRFYVNAVQNNIVQKQNPYNTYANGNVL